MSWDKASELLVPGDGELYIAPVGTTLPAHNTDPTANLNAAFYGLGYWTEDGLSFKVTPQITDFRAFQSLRSVRRERTQQDFDSTCQLEQWNEKTVPAALGGEITSSGGFYTWLPPQDGDALDEWSAVIDIQDGDRNLRIVYPRTNLATEATEVAFKRGEMGTLPVGLKALPPTNGSESVYILFDDSAAFAAGS